MLGWRDAAPLVAALAVAVTAPAGAGADEKEDAAKLLAAGDRRLAEGDRLSTRAERLSKRGRTERAAAQQERAVEAYERALAAYEKAYDLVANPKIYFPIAKAELELGRHRDAITHYYKLVEEVPDMDELLRAEADKVLAEAKLHVATLVLTIEPEGAYVTVDEADVGEAPLDRPLYLEPGDHTVAVTFAGYTPFETTLTLEAGAESEQEIVLEEIPVVVTEPKPKPKPLPPPPDPPDKLPIILYGSGTGALFLTTMATGISAVSKHNDYTNDALSPQARQSAKDKGKRLAITTDIFGILTLGAAAWTGYYYFKIFRPQQAEYRRKLRERRKLEREREEDGGGVDDDNPLDDNPLDDDPLGALGAIPPPKLWVAPYVSMDGDGGGLAVSIAF